MLSCDKCAELPNMTQCSCGPHSPPVQMTTLLLHCNGGQRFRSPSAGMMAPSGRDSAESSAGGLLRPLNRCGLLVMQPLALQQLVVLLDSTIAADQNLIGVRIVLRRSAGARAPAPSVARRASVRVSTLLVAFHPG